MAWSGGGCIIVTSTIRCDVVWHIGEAIVIVASRVCRADYQRCIPCNSRIQIGASSEPPADSSPDAFKRQQTNLSVVPMMSCRLSDAGLLSAPCWSIVSWGHEKASQWKSDEDIHIFYKENEFVYKHYMLSWPCKSLTRRVTGGGLRVDGVVNSDHAGGCHIDNPRCTPVSTATSRQ